MRSVLRHLSPLIRSRRRISFLFTISLLLSLAFILFIINHKRQSQIFIKQTTTKQQSKPSNNVSKIIQKDILTAK